MYPKAPRRKQEFSRDMIRVEELKSVAVRVTGLDSFRVISSGRE